MSSERIGAKGESLRLRNNEWFIVRSADGASDIPVFRVNTLDVIEFLGGGGGGGDVVGPASSVDGQVALFNSITGKLIKTATGTGVAHLTSGVLSTSQVLLVSEVSGILPVANGGTGISSPSGLGNVLMSDGLGNWVSSAPFTNPLGDIQLGTLDAFSRYQIWNKGLNSVIRAGSWQADGDATNMTSEGVVVYGNSLTGLPLSAADGGFARIKPDRFGLLSIDTSLPAYSSPIAPFGEYYFRTDKTSMYLRNDLGVKTFEVNRASGSITTSMTAGAVMANGSGVLSSVAAGAIGDVLSSDGLGNWVSSTPLISRVQNCSVNFAETYIDIEGKLNFFNYIRTNTAGNFNGGGTGNKMICGLKNTNNGITGVPLASIPSFECEATIRQPVIPTAGSHEYLNVLATLDVPRVMSFESTTSSPDSTISNLPFGDTTFGAYSLQRTLISGTTFKYEMNPATSAVKVVVQGQPVNVVAGAILGVHYVVQAGAPATNSVSYWLYVCYSMASLQLLFPLAVVADAVSTDGGMPKSKLCNGMMIITGDSATSTYIATKVNYLKLNGVTII